MYKSNQSINQSVYYAQGSTIEYSKQNEYKMKTTWENNTTLKTVGKIMKSRILKKYILSKQLSMGICYQCVNVA